MKKLVLLVAILCLFTTSQAFAAAGACTQTVSKARETITVLTFECTASTVDGSFPAIAVTPSNMSQLLDLFLILGSTFNGATAPQALFDITLTDAIGVDILGTAGMNRPAVVGGNSQFTPITDTTYATGGLRPITSNLTLNITNNNVTTALFTIQLFFSK
jgi:hypothetical protein